MFLKYFKNLFENSSGLNVFIRLAITMNESTNTSNPIITPDVIRTPFGGPCASEMEQNVISI